MNSILKAGRAIFEAAQIYLVWSILAPNIAWAYVDPGSGSVIITTVLGFIAAIGYTFRKYFYAIRRKLVRRFHANANDEEDK